MQISEYDITNEIGEHSYCIPVLSLSGNPNFSLLLPNPGKSGQS